jgi:alcohol dehydrogenase (cytochrome c)
MQETSMSGLSVSSLLKPLSPAVVVSLLAWAPPALAADDAAAGSKIFTTQCGVCHSNQAGVNGFGPSLAGVVGRRAAAIPGFKYTTALKNSDLTWSTANLDQFFTDSAKKVPGTAMAVAIPQASDRSDLIAYLSSLVAAAPATATPAAAQNGQIKGPTQAELDNAAASRENWLYATHDYTGTRFADIKQITAANAASLRAVCLYRSEQPAPTQTNPIVYDGAMYLTFARATVAIDATNCHERWTYNWQPRGHEISPTNRGVAVKDGKLIRGTADGYLIALDMGTGDLLWSRQIASAADSQYLSMPPLIWNDLILYGPAGADFGQKNWIGAFRLSDGEPVWRFNLIPDPGQPGADTWKSQEALKHGGGSLWTPLSLDEKAGVLYVPVGNPAPDFFGAVRPGDNLYTNSLVALDVHTGKLLWYRQFVSHDEHDSDTSQVSPLFSFKAGNATRDVVAVSGKDGLLRLIDRRTHDELYQVPVTTRENVDASPTVEGVHRCPGLLGGMEWNGPAYDPNNNRLFVAAVDWCGVFKKFDAPPPFTPEAHYYGGSVTPDAHDKSKGWLTAFDAATGKELWKYASPTPLVAGVTATSGGVLFTGDLDDNFLALDAANGSVLYRFNTGGSIGGGTVTYERGGKQYVAIASGSVSAFFGGSGLPLVAVFALPDGAPK